MLNPNLVVFNADAIERLKDGIEELFEGKEALRRELFLDGLKGIQILEQFLRSESEVSQSDLRELSLALNRVLCEFAIAIADGLVRTEDSYRYGDR